MDNIASINSPEFGYVNNLCQTDYLISANNKLVQTEAAQILQFALGTEFGLHFIEIKGIEMTIIKESYFKGLQVS